MSRLNRAAQFLGLRRGIAGLLTMVILVGLGERMAERLLPVYLLALCAGNLALKWKSPTGAEMDATQHS